MVAVKRVMSTMNVRASLRVRDFKCITNTANSLYQLWLEIAVNLTSQSMYEDIDDIRLRVEMVVPDMLQNHGLGDYVALVAHEVFEQRELPRLELHHLSVPCDVTLEQIELQIAHLEGLPTATDGGPTDQRLNPSEQLGKGERFGQIVVSTGLQSFYLVIDRATGTENQHGSRHTLPSQGVDEGNAVQTRQHDVHHQGIVGCLPGRLKCRLAVADVIDGQTGLSETTGDEDGDIPIILNNQHS
ncbi:hypothetical protein LCGC14_3163150, partial [marine sediment metagenome]